MFSHVMLGTDDIQKSKKFYDAIMAVLGYPEGVIDEKGRCFYANPDGVFALTLPINGQPSTVANGMTIGFKVKSPEQGNMWHAAGLENGGVACEDAPGIRVGATRSLYLAYLRDPSGHKICATYFVPDK
jgi:catechol 2,3-dioxygenase-like lactoylglutathione lyase family enzyme